MKTNSTNIFIVEDDPFFANMLNERLKKESYNNVHVYHTGEEALNKLYEQPDIVILDHGLGKLNGIQVLKKIKSVNPNIQVIFLSAQEQMNVAIQALKYGAYDYLEKNSDGLKRLSFLLKRVIYQNNAINENIRMKRQFRWFVAGLVALELAILAYAFSY